MHVVGYLKRISTESLVENPFGTSTARPCAVHIYSTSGLHVPLHQEHILRRRGGEGLTSKKSGVMAMATTYTWLFQPDERTL